MNRFLLLLLLCPTWLQAIDLNGVYELAKQHDSTIGQVREQLGATREGKPQAEARLLPTIGIAADTQLVDIDSTHIPKGPSHGQYMQQDLTLQLSHPLYHRDYWIQLDQAQDSIDQGEIQLAGSEIDLMVRTATAYFNVLAAADDLRAATAEKAANAKQLDQAQQRFQVGLIAITDVHESQAAYDSSVAQEITADNALSNAWEALREIVGDLHQAIAKLGDTLPLRPPQPDSVESWAVTALQRNYNIQSAKKAVDKARKAIDIQHSGYYPTVDLVASYGIADSTSSTFGNDQNVGMIGLQLKLPLFQGGVVSSRERQAVQEYRVAQDALDQHRKEVNRQVRSAYRGVIATASRVKALQSAVVSSQTALQSTQAGFEVGTRTMVDVLTMTRSLYQAQRDYARARYDYVLNGLLLQQAAGSLSPEVIDQANSWLTKDQVQPSTTTSLDDIAKPQ